MTRLLLIFLLAFPGIGGASVTVAWKVPIKPWILYESAPRKLDKPPGESAFFEVGDGLWDASDALDRMLSFSIDDPFETPEVKAEEIHWKGEWIVWNERSGMFIARGTWEDIQDVEQALDFESLPTVMRSGVDVMEASAGEDSPPVKLRSLSVVSRSGEETRAVLDGCEMVVLITDSDGICDADCQLSWPTGGEGRRWKLKTAVTVREGVRTRLARKGEGPDSWEAWITVSRELTDGTPYREARWIETAEGLKPCESLEAIGRNPRMLLAPKRELRIHRVPGDLLVKMAGEKVAATFPEVTAPTELAEWVRGPLIDIGNLLRENGLMLDPAAGHFGGFDSEFNRVFIVADPAVQDLAQWLFSGPPPEFPSVLWIESNSKSGGWGLFVRSGEKGGISRMVGDVPGLSFEIEPSIGSYDEIIELGYKFDVASGEASLGRIESNTTLLNGKPQRIATHSKEGMEDLEMVLTCTVTGE